MPLSLENTRISEFPLRLHWFLEKMICEIALEIFDSSGYEKAVYKTLGKENERHLEGSLLHLYC